MYFQQHYDMLYNQYTNHSNYPFKHYRWTIVCRQTCNFCNICQADNVLSVRDVAWLLFVVTIGTITLNILFKNRIFILSLNWTGNTNRVANLTQHYAVYKWSLLLTWTPWRLHKNKCTTQCLLLKICYLWITVAETLTSICHIDSVNTQSVTVHGAQV